jgi:uncharacterized protein (TIGR03085 family)
LGRYQSATTIGQCAVFAEVKWHAHAVTTKIQHLPTGRGLVPLPRVNVFRSPRAPEGHDALLARFAQGPTRSIAWADEAVNFLEYVIQDVRRGAALPLQPRRLPDEEQQVIWTRLRSMSRLGYRRAPVGVTLALPSGPHQVVHQDEGGVVLTGDPVELLLYASGRRQAAHVELTGTPESHRRFETWVSSRRGP